MTISPHATLTSMTSSNSFSAINRRHWRALEQIEDTDLYTTTRALYREALGGTDVFLRPTSKGFTVLSLDADHCRSMIGVGARSSKKQHVLPAMPPDPAKVQLAVEGYEAKRDSLGRCSLEETYSLRLVASALEDGLSLGPFYFITQEWRLPSGRKIDILCADPEGQCLVVVELKDSEKEAFLVERSKVGNAWDQARAYAEEIYEHRGEFYPFFQRLGRALARHHGAPARMRDLTLDLGKSPRCAVSWPGGGFS